MWQSKGCAGKVFTSFVSSFVAGPDNHPSAGGTPWE